LPIVEKSDTVPENAVVDARVSQRFPVARESEVASQAIMKESVWSGQRREGGVAKRR